MIYVTCFIYGNSPFNRPKRFSLKNPKGGSLLQVQKQNDIIRKLNYHPSCKNHSDLIFTFFHCANA